MADCEVDQGRDVAGGNIARDRLEGAADDGLAALVVQLGRTLGEQSERVSGPSGEEPLLEGMHGLAGVLEPPRRPLVVLVVPRRPHQLPAQRLAHQRMDPEPVLVAESVHEKSLRFAAQQQLTGVRPPGDRRRQSGVDSIDHRDSDERVDHVCIARRQDFMAHVVLGE